MEKILLQIMRNSKTVRTTKMITSTFIPNITDMLPRKVVLTNKINITLYLKWF